MPDKDIIYSDHDLLVQLNTKMDIFIGQQYRFQDKYAADSKDIVQRITALEVSRASDLAAIGSNKEDIDTLQKRSNLFDGLNAMATAIMGGLALLLGGK